MGEIIRSYSFTNFKGQDARGQNDDWLMVVGIVADMRRSGLDKEPIPHVYEPNTQAIGGYRTADLVVRVAGSAGALSSPLRAVVRESDRAALLSSVMTLQTELWDQLSPRRFQALLLSLFSLVALLLAGVGIYGVLGYSITRRTHEIGIRMALGAHPREVARLVVKDGAKFAVIGLLIGVIGAAAITQFLKSLLFGIASTDPVTFVGVAFSSWPRRSSLAISLLSELHASIRLLRCVMSELSLKDIRNDLCCSIDAEVSSVRSTISLMDPDGARLWHTIGTRVPRDWLPVISPLPCPSTRYPRSEYAGINIPPLAIRAMPNGEKAIEAL